MASMQESCIMELSRRTSMLFSLTCILLLCCKGTATALSTRPAVSSSFCSSAAAANIVWFREHGLRTCDNEALSAAIEKCEESILPVYLWSDDDEGTASSVFTAEALQGLNQTLAGQLAVGLLGNLNKHHDHEVRIRAIAKELSFISECNGGAKDVFYLESPHADEDDALVMMEAMKGEGLRPHPFASGSCLLDQSKHVPWKNIIQEHPFRSPLIPFVDYALNQLEKDPPSAPLDEPALHTASRAVVQRPVSINHLQKAIGNSGNTDWGSSLVEAWPATEQAGRDALIRFLDAPAAKQELDDGNNKESNLVKRTHLASRLSPYLARGVLSARQVYHQAMMANNKNNDSFARRICWRDYTYAVAKLYPVDEIIDSGKPIREGYEQNEHLDGNQQFLLDAWKEGKTGFPLVDAGMRQLITEGWMPQKVRLVVATCLVEGLRLPWQAGMRHFAEFLIDYDKSINTNMWMNAGCVGFDPYYIGLNYKRRPYWDKEGGYVRTWCPDLRQLPDYVELPESERGIGTYRLDCLYEPWAAPDDILQEADVVLGRTYPNRVCDERSARREFFTALREQRSCWDPSMTDEKGRDKVRLGRNCDAESIGMFTPKVLLIRSI